MRSQWVRPRVCKSCILWNMQSDVQVKPSQKSVLCRYTGLTRIAISALLLAPIIVYHLQVRICAEISLVVGVEIGTSFGVPRSKIWNVCGDISTLDRIFLVYGVLSQCLLHRNTRDSPSHECNFF